MLNTTQTICNLFIFLVLGCHKIVFGTCDIICGLISFRLFRDFHNRKELKKSIKHIDQLWDSFCKGIDAKEAATYPSYPTQEDFSLPEQIQRRIDYFRLSWWNHQRVQKIHQQRYNKELNELRKTIIYSQHQARLQQEEYQTLIGIMDKISDHLNLPRQYMTSKNLHNHVIAQAERLLAHVEVPNDTSSLSGYYQTTYTNSHELSRRFTCN